jgi:hypothetical protein
MLDVSKLEAGMLGAWRKNCLVPAILQHTWTALERKALVKNVELEWDIPVDLPEAVFGSCHLCAFLPARF